MNVKIMIAVGTLLAGSSLSWAQTNATPMQAHPSPVTTNQASTVPVPLSAVGPETFGMQAPMPAMQKKMQTMLQQMNEINRTEDPAKRAELLQEHRETMQEMRQHMMQHMRNLGMNNGMSMDQQSSMGNGPMSGMGMNHRPQRGMMGGMMRGPRFDNAPAGMMGRMDPNGMGSNGMGPGAGMMSGPRFGPQVSPQYEMSPSGSAASMPRFGEIMQRQKMMEQRMNAMQGMMEQMIQNQMATGALSDTVSDKKAMH